MTFNMISFFEVFVVGGNLRYLLLFLKLRGSVVSLYPVAGLDDGNIVKDTPVMIQALRSTVIRFCS